MSGGVFPRYPTKGSVGCVHLKEQPPHKYYLDISIAD